LIYRVFVVGLVAGLIAGAALTAIQFFKIVPLIAAAEVYEDAAAEAHAHAHVHESATSKHEAAWEPAPGFQRIALTFLANLIIAIGFGLVLSGGFALRQAIAGQHIDAHEGLLWGLAGFAAFALAPALGLPPEPPGMISADIVARQTWWLGTALATCGGLGLIAFSRHWLAVLAGIALLLLPHVIGAPLRPAGDDAVTAAIAAQFVAASLVTSAVFWCVLGVTAGWLYDLVGRRSLIRQGSPHAV
jgi:cobalt transporter subunit CbtA